MALIEINWNPDRKQLRSFAIMWFVFFAFAGALVAWRAGLIGGARGARVRAGTRR